MPDEETTGASIEPSTARRSLRILAYPAVMAAGMALYAAALDHGIGVGPAAFGSITAGMIVILALERWIPYRHRWRASSGELRTDVAYLVLVQTALPLVLALGVASALSTGGLELWPTGWPLAAQFLLMLLAADGLRYALHRAAHGWDALWRLHSLHHAPAKLHALNVGRFHPTERTLQYAAEALPFAILGAPPAALAAYTVFHSLHGFFQHANVDVRLGALNLVVSGPELHRWHHSRLPDESNHNFANHLTLWDLLFGTYFRPADRAVGELGVDDAPARHRRLRATDALLRLHMSWIRWSVWRPTVAAAQHPREVQLEVLRSIVRRASRTPFGRAHDFDSIDGIEGFRRAVPVQTHDSLAPYLGPEHHTAPRGEAPVMYARTSGTAGAPRLFPVTRRALRSHARNLSLSAYVHHRDVPGAYTGRILAIVGPAVEGRLPSGLPFGSISGALHGAMPRLARAKYVVPQSVFTLYDYELQYLLIARLGLAEPNLSAMATANPSTFLKLLDTIRAERDRLADDLDRGAFSRIDELPPEISAAVVPLLACAPERAAAVRRALAKREPSYADLWPDLRLVSTWTGGSCGIALARLRALLPESTRVVELGYLASELRASVTIDAASGAGLPTLCENFFEFAEKGSWERGQPRFRLLHELEVGRDYHVFVTTESGLYRYFINDIVRVTGRFHATPTIAFVQKGKGVTSITGEKLYEGQVLDAVHAVEREMGGAARFFLMLADVEKARYRLLVESDGDFAPDASRFAARVDVALGERSLEYRAKRASGRLAPLEVRCLREGFGAAYRASCVRDGQREGQFKTIALQYAADFRFDDSRWAADRAVAAVEGSRS